MERTTCKTWTKVRSPRLWCATAAKCTGAHVHRRNPAKSQKMDSLTIQRVWRASFLGSINTSSSKMQRWTWSLHQNSLRADKKWTGTLRSCKAKCSHHNHEVLLTSIEKPNKRCGKVDCLVLAWWSSQSHLKTRLKDLPKNALLNKLFGVSKQLIE